jgi:hypothetical protein
MAVLKVETWADEAQREPTMDGEEQNTHQKPPITRTAEDMDGIVKQLVE